MRQQSSSHRSGNRPLPKVPLSYYSDFIGLLREQLKADPSYKAEYLASEIESKLRDGTSSVTDAVRRERAIEKWLAREVLNRKTNSRIMFCNDTEDFLFLDKDGFPVFAREILDWCRMTVTHLLGDTIPWASLRGSFSGGASTSVRRGVGNVPRKYQAGKDITVGAIYPYLALTASAVGMPRDFDLVEGNVMFTVPKTSEIDRVACKEPDLNMYCQKAVGDYIRHRLKSVGVDLNDQTVNQMLARQGSIDGSLATVDLSSASDSVTVQLVMEVLPIEWAHLLMDLRSPVTVIDGISHVNEMISSMGNAFTFELESLLFWVLTRACARFTGTTGRISVYGDDIICPSGLKDAVEATFEFFGFTLNPKKSYWSGPFRESCGKHWHNGYDVTPFYVKQVPKDLSDWCLLLNSFRKWASDLGICDPQYWALWSLFAELIPRPLWGAKDLARRDALVAPNIRCLARLQRKQLERRSVEVELQYGAYLQWLDTTKDRAVGLDTHSYRSAREGALEQLTREGRELWSPVETNMFTELGELFWRQRPAPDWSVGIPVFPQEL